MKRPLATLFGVIRSLRIYHLDRSHHRAMDQLYRQFVGPGDLAFDIGAHVGDRVASFRRLGARVVAVEPQPALVTALKLIHGRDSGVAIEAQAVGRAEGWLKLFVNAENPTISTASSAFIQATRDAPGWEGQNWSTTVEVPVTTLDRLIARHGRPAFVKIDVEGFEAEVLAGLGARLPAVSFEFTTIQREVAHQALAELDRLGRYRFNAALGESQRLVYPDWVDRDTIRDWLDRLDPRANSGDIYAVALPD